MQAGWRLLLALTVTIAAPLFARAAPAQAEPARNLVTAPVDDGQTTGLPGNTRPETHRAQDLGPLPDGFVLNHMQLILKRPLEREAALVTAIAALHDPASPQFHHWLTPAQFGADYGPADTDIQAVATWLQGHGFVVNSIATGKMAIDFSGTAGSIHDAFGTSMHALAINGAHHIANMSDPRIPAALAGVIQGVASLNDFRPHTNFKPRPNYTFSGTTGGTEHAVVPADLATIYNLNPLFAKGISGQGQTVVVIEDTNIHAAADWHTFRTAFGLNTYTAGSLIQVHPASSKPNNCSNPGTVVDSEEEAQLDTEWASASAPSAEIEVASCSDTQTTFGGLIALQNLLNGATPPAIVSISYGECESSNGTAANAAYNTTYQQAVAEGTSVFVSAGDEGAASCDADEPTSTDGIAVSGFASTPYNVAVGGTDFSDTYSGTTANYWNAANTPVYGSAKSYIPEIPWNDSCASVLIATSQGYATPYGLAGFCNSVIGATYLSTASGSGGPSGCATGTGPETGGVGGTCKGYAKPSWQVLLGVPSDGVRDLPDVSLFAANGVWNHYYLFCDSDPADDSNLCKGPPSGWAGAGGTSFSSPILAGIQSLVNQTTGSRQGNPNPTYYAMAATEYGAAGSAKCNSSKGAAAGVACIFYDVTLGDMDVNCLGIDDCYHDLGVNGVLSTSDARYRRAYATNTGWDFATGIGTLNATNLVEGWSAAQSRLAVR